MTVDREINITSKSDAKKYISELEEQNQMEQKLRSYGSEIKAGYTMTVGQLQAYFQDYDTRKKNRR